jgi:hypothetical protein
MYFKGALFLNTLRNVVNDARSGELRTTCSSTSNARTS